MLNIDGHAYASKLKQKSPEEKLVFSLLTLLVCLWADWLPVSITVLLLMAWSTVRLGGTPFAFYTRLLCIPLTFLLMGTLTMAIEISQQAGGFLIFIPVKQLYLGISKEGLLQMAGIIFKSMGAVSCMYFLSLTTPLIDILSVLRRLKCPQLLIEMMGLIYRFIFVLMETADTILTAQSSRLGYSGLKNGYRSLGMLAASLFVKAWKRSEEIHTALEARGYEGDLIVLDEVFQRDSRNYIAIIVINLFFVLAAIILKPFAGGLA